MQQVLDNLKELPSGTEAKDIDLIFLRGIIESPVVRSLAKARSCPQYSTTIQSNCLVTKLWLKKAHDDKMTLDAVRTT